MQEIIGNSDYLLTGGRLRYRLLGMEPRKTIPRTDITGTLSVLPEEKRKLYIGTLYAIAKTAIEARCGELNMSDLEILASLEEEAEARFCEWLVQMLPE